MALPAVPALPMGVAGKHWGRQREASGGLDSCSCQAAARPGVLLVCPHVVPKNPGQMVGLHKQPCS